MSQKKNYVKQEPTTSNKKIKKRMSEKDLLKLYCLKHTGTSFLKI